MPKLNNEKSSSFTTEIHQVNIPLPSLPKGSQIMHHILPYDSKNVIFFSKQYI